MDELQRHMLEQVSGIHEIPEGAYNIRSDGKSIGRNSTANIQIDTKTDKPGIDIHIKPGTVHESVHIPVILSQTGLTETVYNDFFVGDNADVTIVAGCGIHNCGEQKSEHDGIHTFYIGKNAKVKYIEKHYGEGDGTGERVLNPQTIVHIDEGGYMEMDTVQIKGVDSTVRVTRADLKEDAKLIIREKIMPHGNQTAKTDFSVDLNGSGCGADVVSRSVAKDHSRQQFISKINGNNNCTGHTECDAIIMEGASVSATPELTANHIDASLIHAASLNASFAKPNS